MSLQWKWLIIAFWILSGAAAVSGLTVIDFEQYRGAGGGRPQIQGMTFDSDFSIYTSQLGQIPAHSGDVRVRSNAYAEGWRECSFTFNTPNQRFVGVWMYVFSDSAQLRMYKDGQGSSSRPVRPCRRTRGGHSWNLVTTGRSIGWGFGRIAGFT
jgi:hypothetical protein